MMISTKGRYTLRVMVDLAENRSERYIPLKEIARRQEISEKYMETILPVLIKNNYLTALRGKGGGYKLSREPESYTVGSILRLVERNMATVACPEVGAHHCSRASECRTLPMWQKLDNIVNDFFDGITLADLCRDVASNDFAI